MTGGIVGYGSGTHSITNVVNSMTGNIIGTAWFVGGITGRLISSTATYDALFNYMTGDISVISGTMTGGIFGASNNSITNSINAMNGNVNHSVVGSGTASTTVTVNTDFGLTYTYNTSGTSTPLTGFLASTGFPLPYFLLSGTDSVGSSYDYHFVFANLGGNNSYSNTHLLILNSVDTFQDGAISLPALPLVITPRVSNVTVIVGAVTGSIAYRLTSQTTGTVEKTVKNNFTDLTQTISSLTPSTEYTFRLYSTEDGTVYTLVDTVVTTTLVNSAVNYHKNDYLSNGKFDISSLDEASLNLLSDLMNDVFATGDLVVVKVLGKSKNSKFVNRGGILDVTDAEAVVTPFSTDGGTGQTVSLTLSSASTVGVSYDDTTEEVTIDASTYNTGDTFVLDGKKVTIVDI